MDKESVGKCIRDHRLQLHLSQKELAEKLHVSDKAVSKWERAESFPDILLLEDIAKALQITLSELIQADHDVDEKENRNEKQSAEEAQFSEIFRLFRNRLLKNTVHISLAVLLSITLLAVILIAANWETIHLYVRKYNYCFVVNVIDKDDEKLTEKDPIWEKNILSGKQEQKVYYISYSEYSDAEMYNVGEAIEVRFVGRRLLPNNSFLGNIQGITSQGG